MTEQCTCARYSSEALSPHLTMESPKSATSSRSGMNPPLNFRLRRPADKPVTIDRTSHRMSSHSKSFLVRPLRLRRRCTVGGLERVVALAGAVLNFHLRE